MAVNLKTDDGVLVNQSTADTYGLVYHAFNISFPGKSQILLYVKTFNSSAFLNILLRPNDKPIPLSYTWKCPILKSTNKSAFNEYMTVLAPEDVYSNTTQMFVGIQKGIRGCYLMWLCFVVMFRGY